MKTKHLDICETVVVDGVEYTKGEEPEKRKVQKPVVESSRSKGAVKKAAAKKDK